MPSSPFTCSVIIPVHDELPTLRPLVEAIAALPEFDQITEVLIVDDGSRDGSAESVQGVPKVRVLQHQVKQGIGRALQTALAEAAGSHFIKLDGDGQHPTSAIPAFLGQLRSHDYVEGVRSDMQLSLPRKLGNLGLTALANLFMGHHEADFMSGFYGARCDFARPFFAVRLPPRAGFTAYIKLSLLVHAGSVSRVPYVCARRTAGSSKVAPISDGLRVVRVLLALSWRHARARFLALAVLAAAIPAVGLWLLTR